MESPGAETALNIPACVARGNRGCANGRPEAVESETGQEQRGGPAVWEIMQDEPHF